MADDRIITDMDASRLPYSVEAEQSVLGALIIDPKTITEVAELIKPEYFYIPQHREIFSVMSSMFEINRTIDLVTLVEKLKDAGVYDEAGGKAYISQLIQTVPSAANVLTYVTILRERYYTRALILAAQKIIKDASDNVQDSEKLLNSAEQSIYEIRQGRDISGLVPIKEVIAGETYDRLTKITDPETRNDYIGIPTGIGELDKVITGLNKSDLIIVGARPGMGKTAFALTIARNVALKAKKTVCFFSLEMSRDQLAQRLLSSEAAIPSTKLRTGELSPDEWTRLGEAGNLLSGTNIYLDETSGITVPEMKAKLLRMKKVDLVIVDYLGLMRSRRKTENRVQEVQEITGSLKIMAKELKVPVMVCAQLGRGTATSKTHIPALSDLRESGSIEQDADIVLFIHRDAYYDNEKEEGEERSDTNSAKCIVAKNRHGGLDTIDLHWDGQYTRFASPDVFR